MKALSKSGLFEKGDMLFDHDDGDSGNRCDDEENNYNHDFLNSN